MILNINNIQHCKLENSKELYKKIHKNGFLRIWFCDKGVNLSHYHKTKANYIIDGRIAMRIKKECPYKNT